MDISNRASWGAKAPKKPYSQMPIIVKGIKFHYTGGYVDPEIVNSRGIAIKMLQAFQHLHMAGHGWNDFAYNYAISPDEVFTGRGMRNMSAANGAGFNSGHYAVLLMVGNTGLLQPPDSMLNLACDLIDYMHTKDPRMGKELKGHRDGYSTECPGDHVYKWVKAGCPRPKKKEGK